MLDGIPILRANAMFDGTATGRGRSKSDEIGPTPNAADLCATAPVNDAFDLHCPTVWRDLEACSSEA